jgi:hypothetical protein
LQQSEEDLTDFGGVCVEDTWRCVFSQTAFEHVAEVFWDGVYVTVVNVVRGLLLQ